VPAETERARRHGDGFHKPCGALARRRSVYYEVCGWIFVLLDCSFCCCALLLSLFPFKIVRKKKLKRGPAGC
jgi:hypothetical protein